MFDLGIPDESLLASEEEEEPEPEEMPAQPAPQANVDEADEPEEPETPQKALTRAMPWPTYGSDEHKAMLETWEKALAPREARMRQALKQLFAEQEKDVLRRLNEGKGYTLSPAANETRATHYATKGAADTPFDLAKWIRLFRLRLSPQIRLTLAEAGRDAMNDLNIGVSFDVADPQVLNYMRDRENKIKGVVEKTFDDLKRDISQGIEAGESIDKIAARVQERMGPIADGRATAIARTEVIGASNGGKVLAWKQSGVVTGKRWLASTSHMGADDPNPVRESHVEAHGQEVKIDEDFSVGNGEGKAPGQIGLPEEDINCRCTMLAVTDQGRGLKSLPEPEQARETPAPAQVFNITMPPITITANMPAQAAPVVNVAAAEVTMPEQPAPVVNVSIPEAKEQPAPVVNVSLPKATSQTQTVNRDEQGNIISTTTRINYEGQ